MKRALLLLVLAGCVPPPAPQPEPEPPISIREAHPRWTDKECEAVAEGAFWEGMDIEQFKCSYCYGKLNRFSYPAGPHTHEPFDRVSQTKDGLIVTYSKPIMRVTGWFDNDMRLTNYVRSTR